MKDGKQVIAIIGNDATLAARTLVESMRDDIIIVDSVQDAAELLKGTSYPDLKPNKPFIITAPPIYERTFEDFQSGKEKRRDRRARERINISNNQ